MYAYEKITDSIYSINFVILQQVVVRIGQHQILTYDSDDFGFQGGI